MGRSRGFTSALIQIQRDAERRRRTELAAQRRIRVEADRAKRAYERASATEKKEQSRLYVEAQLADVELRNEDLKDRIAELERILSETLDVDDFLDFEVLKDAAPLPAFTPGRLAIREPPPDPAAFRPSEPGVMQRLMPGARQRYAAQLEASRRAGEVAVAAHHDREADRLRRLAAAQAEHQRAEAETKARLATQHAEIEEFKEAFQAGKPEAVSQYFALVLEASQYPDGFPLRFRLAFVPESRQLVVEYQLPLFDCVPLVSEYRYVKTGDKITEKSRAIRERHELYKSVVAQVTVRTIHELFESDRSVLIETVIFNGHVETINAATGKIENPCLV